MARIAYTKRQTAETNTANRELTDRPLAIYYRQSTDVQTRKNKGSAKQQTVDLFEKALKWGWKPDQILRYNDPGVSGTLPIDQRPGMTAMFQANEAHPQQAAGNSTHLGLKKVSVARLWLWR